MRLKARTRLSHERLDQRIMAARPFEARLRYVAFLRLQHAFHRDIDALYDNPALDRLLPDLRQRRRLALIERDLDDLAVGHPAAGVPAFDVDADVPTALGWLYVAEGSTLGAAFLLKQAARLGLSDTYGARHLAAHPQGRGLHWRTFTRALDELSLSQGEEERAVAGAQAAFRRVHALVDALLAG